MADIFFKCAACGQNLLIEDTAVGEAYECLECHGQMTIPAPVSEVECAGCRQTLKVAAGMGGQSVRCPNCREPVTVPSEERPRVKLKGESTPPPLLVAATSPSGAECPGCHAPVMAEAVICVQCGLNLKTGKKMTAASTSPSMSRTEVREAKESRGKLIKNVVLIVVVVGIFAFALPRLWDVFSPSTPKYVPPAPTPATSGERKAPGTPPMPGPGMMPPGFMPGQPMPTNAVAKQNPPMPPGPMMPPGFPMPPGGPTSPAAANMPMPPPGMSPMMPMPPAPVTNVVAQTNAVPPPPPPKPPAPLLTMDDLRKLGTLPKLTVDGVEYANVRWTRVSYREAFFFHSGGAASVPIVRLLPALKEQHHFEPPKHE